MKKHRIKGFTLIELLVVVLIIGILASIALPSYNRAVLKSRMMSSLIAARELLEAQRLFYLANGTYATDFSELDISYNCSPDNTGITVYCGSNNLVITFSNNHFMVKHKASGYLGIWIDVYWATGRILCVAQEDDADTNSICKSLSGTSEYEVQNGVYRAYDIMPARS